MAEHTEPWLDGHDVGGAPPAIGEMVREWNAAHPEDPLFVTRPKEQRPWITRELQAQLMEPFPDRAVGILPKLNCRDCSDSPSKACKNHQKVKCDGCGNWMSEKHVHLDYVGHGWVTHRLLAVDPTWNWEPALVDQHGLPAQVQGVFWIRLTVCGVTRWGAGDSPKKHGTGDWWKEVIGDALRNAAMRFGVALEMWQRDRHGSAPEEFTPQTRSENRQKPKSQSSAGSARRSTSSSSRAGSAGGEQLTGSIGDIRKEVRKRFDALPAASQTAYLKSFGEPEQLKAGQVRNVGPALAAFEAGAATMAGSTDEPDVPETSEDVETPEQRNRRILDGYVDRLSNEDLQSMFSAMGMAQPAELTEARSAMIGVLAGDVDEAFPTGVGSLEELTEWFEAPAVTRQGENG